MVRLSALGTGRLYPQKIFVVCISFRCCVDFRDIVPLSQMTSSGIDPSLPVMSMMMMMMIMQTKKKMSLLVD